MPHKFLITVLFFSIQSIFSQSSTIPDSLLNKSYRQLESKIKSNIIGDSLKSIYINSYLAKAKTEKDTVEIGNGFHYKANEKFYYKDGGYYSTFKDDIFFRNGLNYSDSIIGYTKNIDHRVYPGLGYSHKGFFLYNLGYVKDALDNYLIAYGYALKHNNEIQLPELKEAINAIRNNEKPDSKTTKNYLDSITGISNFRDTNFYEYIHTIDDLINDLQWEKKYSFAQAYIEKGIKESLNSEDEYGLYNGFVFSAGINYYFLNKYDKALDSINKAEDLLDINNLSLAYYFKGKIHQESDTAKAIKYFNKVDSIFQINETPIYGLRDNYKSLIDLHRQNNNYQKQIENIDKLIYVDSIINETKIYVEEKILEGYELPNYKKEKQELIAKLENQKLKRKQYAILSSIAIGITCLMGFYFFNRQRIYKKRYQTILNDIDKAKSKELKSITTSTDNISFSLNISEEIILKMIKGLDEFENEAGFLDNKVSLSSLSKQLNTNSSYLSKVVNTKKGKSFNNYINDLRINYIIEQLAKDRHLRKLTINAIASEVGFNNPESFSKAFYKKTGIYPSYFIKQIEKKGQKFVI